MHTGRVQQPFISERVVRDALDSLIRLTPKEDIANPLQFLTLIDLQLSDPTFPQTSSARQFALHKLLAQMISDQYTHHLRMFDPESLTAEELSRLNRYATADQIASEIKLGIPELSGWSFLFYHYVRVDLGISLPIYCTMGNVEERSLRRYQQHATKRLMEILITEEWTVRKQHFARFLTSLIPRSEGPILVGRDDTLNLLSQKIDEHGKRHLLISGASGIGKTALISTFLNELIQQEKIDKLIWINSPISFDDLNQQLRESVPENQNLPLDEFLSTWRTYIVLDDIELLQENEQQLIKFLQDLPNAVVLMTSHVVTLSVELMHYSLNELSFEAIRSVIQSEYTASSVHEFEQHILRVWDLAGGNPLAAKIVSRYLQFFGYTLSTARVFGLDALYEQVYLALEPEIQHAWLAMAILPAQFLPLVDLNHLSELFASPDLIQTLCVKHLVEIHREAGFAAYKLPTSARQYISNLYHIDKQVKAFLDGVITNLDNSDVMPIEIIESVLSSTWLELPASLQRHLIDSYYEVGIETGRVAIWANLLQPYEANSSHSDIHLMIGYGEALRRLYKWTEAKAVFEKAIKISGKQGLFDSQASAVIGLVKLLRSQGDYAKALKLLERIDTPPLTDQYKQAIMLERIQIELEAGQTERAGEFIENLGDDILSSLLRAEYYLCSSQWNVLSEFASELMRQPLDRITLARLHVLLGNSSEQQGELEAAHTHFFTALTLLETDAVDVYAIARVQTNLGAILVRQGANDEARLLLEAAHEMQVRLQDRVGLAATRHNLHLLNTNIIS